MIRQITLTGALFVFMLITGANQPAQAATDEEIAVSLATLLRSARAVISKNQKHINDVVEAIGFAFQTLFTVKEVTRSGKRWLTSKQVLTEMAKEIISEGKQWDYIREPVETIMASHSLRYKEASMLQEIIIDMN